ncbi:MAG: hypothetical protein EDM79_18705 [Chloroflexi bacterium]|nr:MAG: hypothetical protein EDM79_18705 [Chloroflexota bacterium]
MSGEENARENTEQDLGPGEAFDFIQMTGEREWRDQDRRKRQTQGGNHKGWNTVSLGKADENTGG